MQIIADSGSTKTDWRLVFPSGEQKKYVSEGYNPYFVNTKQIYDSLYANLSPQMRGDNGVPEEVKTVSFYGAGCSTEANNKTVADALKQFFVNAEIYVGHDLLGACRAVLGHHSGFGAILGTGTNTALYNGTTITMNIDSLGYFMGDEGSGAFMGRHLLRDKMRGYLPPELNEAFVAFSPLTNEQIFDRIYNQPLPNRFLANFFRFIDKNRDHEYCQQLIRDSFKRFFDRLVVHYPGYKSHTFNCVGTVGFLCRDILELMANEYGMKAGNFIRSPIEGMVAYHTQQ